MANQRLFSVEADAFSLQIDEQGDYVSMRIGDRELSLPIACTTYTLDGEESETTFVSGTPYPTYTLTTTAKNGTLSIVPGREAVLHLESSQPTPVSRVGLTLFLPIISVFHLAEFRNIGRRIDGSMPFGESFRADLMYNMFLVNVQGTWIRFRTNHKRFRMAEVQIHRHDDLFSFTVTWSADADACLALFHSMEAAIADFQETIEHDFQARRFRDKMLPEWVHRVKLIITADMLRSNWEITHDYHNVRNLAIALKEADCPPDTLLYIPGWQGAYDSTHPTYQPHPELGGYTGFREMVDTIHECGFRVMIHTTGWGIDPYHPDIDRLEKLVIRDEEGDYRAWQTNRKWLPPRRTLKFQTDKVPLGGEAGTYSFSVNTVQIPARCEALFTIGSIGSSAARLKLTVGRRSVTTPPGWFETHDTFDYPFPLLLQAGENELHVEAVGGHAPDWTTSWYQIGYTFVPTSPYSSWTWPILVADTTNPEYIHILTQNIAAVVREFAIDAVHVDATWFYQPDFRQAKDLLLALQATLPGVPICGEAVLAFDEMGYWTFAQAAAQSLIGDAYKRAPAEQGSLALHDGLEELFGWLDKESPICSFAKEYFYSYPHLCAANAFVPVGKVCNIFPPRQIPRTQEELWRTLREAPRMDYVPGLRVNFRQYGLDDETRKAIGELTS